MLLYMRLIMNYKNSLHSDANKFMLPVSWMLFTDDKCLFFGSEYYCYWWGILFNFQGKWLDSLWLSQLNLSDESLKQLLVQIFVALPSQDSIFCGLRLRRKTYEEEKIQRAFSAKNSRKVSHIIIMWDVLYLQ